MHTFNTLYIHFTKCTPRIFILPHYYRKPIGSRPAAPSAAESYECNTLDCFADPSVGIGTTESCLPRQNAISFRKFNKVIRRAAECVPHLPPIPCTDAFPFHLQMVYKALFNGCKYPDTSRD